MPYTIERTFTNITWKKPIYVVDEPKTNRLWAVLEGGGGDRPSRIVRFQDDPLTAEVDTVLEVPGRLIYSLCFHPNYPADPFIYVFSNGPTNDKERTNRVSRYIIKGAVDPASEFRVIEWRSAGHDGGDLAFGLDGFLYITTGDGTSDSDGWVSGQTLDDLLGAVLRIDVNGTGEGTPYRVPSDNPFVSLTNARPEIWAYGLRNPWHMGIDRETGHVWVGNNGQDAWETAHLVRPGENYGWSVYEGSHPFYLNRKRGPTPLVLPTIEHSHSEFRSLTGGVVYYGQTCPELNGAYIYGDYSSGRIWGMKHNGRQVLWHRELADTSLQIAAFRVNQRGDLLIVDHGGGLYRMLPTTNHSPADFPKKLSETGLFNSVTDHRVDPGIIPYSVNATGWADGASAERFIALPGESKIGYAGQTWEFPDSAVLMQTFSRAVEDGAPPARVETRVLLRQQGEWAGYSYRWKQDQTDAVLVPKEGARGEGWVFPSRTECMACHSRAANFVLGLTELQMNREHLYGGLKTNQIDALYQLGLFNKKPAKQEDRKRLVDPYDNTQELGARARAYLHVNCSVCHVEAGGGNSKMDLSWPASKDRLNLLEARPQHDAFGIVNAMLVAPSDPDRSVLLYRLARRSPGQMPPLVSSRVDEEAVRLMRAWIAAMPATRTIVREWTMADLAPHLNEISAARSFSDGQAAFRETGCAQCHRLGGEGGSVGPDLTAIGRRLSPRELLESIIEPSKVIADEYATHEIETSDGQEIIGRIERQSETELVVRPMASDQPSIRVPQSKIRTHNRSQLSNMPAGMLNVLPQDQILDLLAYLLSDADPTAPLFK